MAATPDPDELAKFIEKALEIQLSDLEEPLTEDALAEIARKAGLGEEDWKRLCLRLEEHLQKGRNFLLFENYTDAIVELEQAVALAPYRAEVLRECGRAHLWNWRKGRDNKSHDRSEELLLKALEIDPVDIEAAELLSAHRKHRPSRSPRGRKTAAVAAALALAVAGGFGLANISRDSESVTVRRELVFGLEAGENSRWAWGSGGELILGNDGTAMHTEWHRQGRWFLNPDGSIHLEGPTGTFRVVFENGVGQVRHLQRGGSTTLVAR